MPTTYKRLNAAATASAGTTNAQTLYTNNGTTASEGTEDESIGSKFLSEMFSNSGDWIATSYNGNKRERFARIGYTYDKFNDKFILPELM